MLYSFLMEFTNGTTPCRTHLIRRYGEKFFKECLDNGYIQEYRQNDSGETVYIITEKGRQKRDN